MLVAKFLIIPPLPQWFYLWSTHTYWALSVMALGAFSFVMIRLRAKVKALHIEIFSLVHSC